MRRQDKNPLLSDFQRVGAIRLADAHALLNCGPHHTRAAMYLAGYAIECKLKAVALKLEGVKSLEELTARWEAQRSELYSHNLEFYLRRLPGGVHERFVQNREMYRLFSQHVNQWHPYWRYLATNPAVVEAEKFLQAVEVIYKWLESLHE